MSISLFRPENPSPSKKGRGEALARRERGNSSLLEESRKERPQQSCGPPLFCFRSKRKKADPPANEFFFSSEGSAPQKGRSPGQFVYFPSSLSLSLPTLSVTIKTQAKKGWGHLSSEELLFSVPSFCSFLKLGFWVFFSKENQRAAGSKRHACPRREYGNLNHPLLFLEHK